MPKRYANWSALCSSFNSTVYFPFLSTQQTTFNTTNKPAFYAAIFTTLGSANLPAICSAHNSTFYPAIGPTL
jgi:hypothetical protein